MSETVDAPAAPMVDVEALINLKLPPLNRTAMKVNEMLRDPNTGTRQLAQVVGCDPALTTRLLKMANSCLFFRQAPVISIQQAIEAVGFKSLHDIVMLNAMADGFAKEIGNSVTGRAIWEHSIVVALVARELSNALGLRGTEQAFLCGLLHDIGKVLLLKGEPEKFESLRDSLTEETMLAGEDAVFGLTHAQVGAYVTRQWELPEVVCTVIMYHHHPRHAPMSTVITYIVNAADQIANLNGYGLRLEEMETVLQSESVRQLKLSLDQINDVWMKVKEQVKEVLVTFR